MNGSAARRPYRRPMDRWWRRDPFFMRYMWRELTALAVLVYAVVLTVGVWRLAQGEPAWNGWLAALRSPWSLALHALLLLAFVVHARSWFEIMPKTMAPIVLRGKRVSAQRITRTGWWAVAIASAGVILLARWVTR